MEEPCRPPVAVFDSKVIILPTLEVGFSSDRAPDSPVIEDAALTVVSTPIVGARVPGVGEVLLTVLNKLDIGSIREDAAAAGAFEGSLDDEVEGGLGKEGGFVVDWALIEGTTLTSGTGLVENEVGTNSLAEALIVPK
jgi:hypothetical protein